MDPLGWLRITYDASKEARLFSYGRAFKGEEWAGNNGRLINAFLQADQSSHTSFFWKIKHFLQQDS